METRIIGSMIHLSPCNDFPMRFINEDLQKQ